MTTEAELHKKLVLAIEAKQDTAPIQKNLAEIRAREAAEKELAEAQKVVDARGVLKNKAEAVKAQVEKQDAAIDAFLKLRDSLVEQLQLLLAPMREFSKMQAPSWTEEPGGCYIFADVRQFAAAVQGIPEGYLPADFGCPMLEMEGGLISADGKATEALRHLVAAYSYLAAFKKGQPQLPLRKAEGLMVIDDDETAPVPDPDPPCKVCQHPQLEAIDKALVEGVSLRDIASQYGISKSTIARHKGHLEGTITFR